MGERALDLGSNTFADIKFDWTPDNIGEYKLTIEVEQSEDNNLNNNVIEQIVNAGTEGVDLRGYLSAPYDVIENEEFDFGFRIYNDGGSPAFNTESFIYEVFRDDDGNEVLELIYSETISEIKEQDRYRNSFKWRISGAGRHEFKLEFFTRL